jgi:hypothetical protein
MQNHLAELVTGDELRRWAMMPGTKTFLERLREMAEGRAQKNGAGNSLSLSSIEQTALRYTKETGIVEGLMLAAREIEGLMADRPPVQREPDAEGGY